MKYTILGFQQQKLIDNNLDIKDAVILRNILDRYSSMKMESITVNDERYIWVNWDSFMQDIPLVINNRKTLEARIKKYSDELFILREIKHKKDGRGGTFVYVKPTEKLDEITEYEAPLKNEGYHPSKNRDTTPQKIGNKDSSISDNSIKDIYAKEFLEWYSLYPNPWNKQQSFKNFKKLLKNESYKNLMIATKNYIEYIKRKGTDREFIVRSTNFIGQHKEYLGYLEMQIEPKNIEQPKSPAHKVMNQGCCPTCEGKGVIRQDNEWIECPECKGGRKIG